MLDNPGNSVVTLDYGSGGQKTAELIDTLLRPAFRDAALDALGDGALLDGTALPGAGITGQLAFSTDSFVVDPLFFPGGDIGKLAVCGTVNDLAMCGAVPRVLSLAFILEEGLPFADLTRIVASIAATAKAAGVRIVTGDTKVVEHGRGDGLYINTAGIGCVECPGLTPAAIRPGDVVLLSGYAGDHGTAIMLARSGLGLETALQSDCMPLHTLARAAWQAGGVRCLRDPTRGGVATTLNEFTEGRDLGILLQETAVPIRPETAAACALLGLDPLYCANEGKLLAIAAPEKAEAVLAALQSLPGGENAAIIGTVTDAPALAGRVAVQTPLGGSRLLTRLAGAQLPRIC